MIAPDVTEALVQMVLWVVAGMSVGLVLTLLTEVALWVVYYELESRHTSE